MTLDPEKLKSLIKQILLLFVLTLLLDLALPAIGAAVTHVFFLEEIKALPSHSTSASENRQLYLQKKNDYENRLSIIEKALRNSVEDRDYAPLQALNTLRATYKADLLRLKDPIVISPFYQNRSTFYFLVAHLALGLDIITRTSYSLSPKVKQLVPLAALLYILFDSTNWLRNFVFYNEGRTVFSFVNFDLSPLCFFIQELQALVLCLMIAYYWIYLFNVYRFSFEKTRTWQTGELSLEGFQLTLKVVGGASDFINDLLFRWQTSSLLIVCAFLP